jgi:hypothetical protein
MTDNVDNTPTTNDESSDEMQILKAEIEALKAEAAKERGLKKQILAEKKALEAKQLDNPKATEDDFKKLYMEQLEENESIKKSIKQTKLDALLKSKLDEAGVKTDKHVNAALKLIDKSLIDNADEDGVAIEAAIIRLRKECDFLFEKPVSVPNPKTPADKQTHSNDKTITRADWDNLPIGDQPILLSKGYTIID